MSWKDIVKNEDMMEEEANEEVKDFLDDLDYKVMNASDELRSTIFEFEYDSRDNEMIKEILEGPEMKDALSKVFRAVDALNKARELLVRLQ